MASSSPEPAHEAGTPSTVPTVAVSQEQRPARTPARPRGRPIVGNLPDFLGDPLKFVLRLSREFPDEGLIRFSMVGQPLYLVTSPEIVRHILLNRPDHFTRRAQTGFDKIYLIQARSLSAVDGAPWRRARHLMQPAFHRERIGRFTETMTVAIGEMLDGWSAQPEVNVSSEITDLTLRLACETLLSVKIGSGDARTITRSLQMAYAFLNKSVSPIPTWVPLPGTLRVRAAMRRFHRTLGKIIEEHHTASSSDLLSLLLSARDDQEQPLSDAEIRYELVGILMGGQDGIMLSLVWTLALLAQHPDVQQRLQQEVDTVLGGRVPTLDDLPRLTYMQMVIDESLRLYPQFWMMGRVAAGDEPEPVEGYRIKKDDIFLISPYGMHRHPKYWPDAEKFDPERFNSARKDKIERGTYFPFGLGQRTCIGMPLAQLEMQVTLAMIAQRATLSLGSAGFPEPQVQFALRMRKPLVLHTQPRERS